MWVSSLLSLLTLKVFAWVSSLRPVLSWVSFLERVGGAMSAFV